MAAKRAVNIFFRAVGVEIAVLDPLRGVTRGGVVEVHRRLQLIRRLDPQGWADARRPSACLVAIGTNMEKEVPRLSRISARVEIQRSAGRLHDRRPAARVEIVEPSKIMADARVDPPVIQESDEGLDIDPMRKRQIVGIPCLRVIEVGKCGPYKPAGIRPAEKPASANLGFVHAAAEKTEVAVAEVLVEMVVMPVHAHVLAVEIEILNLAVGVAHRAVDRRMRADEVTVQVVAVFAPAEIVVRAARERVQLLVAANHAGRHESDIGRRVQDVSLYAADTV